MSLDPEIIESFQSEANDLLSELRSVVDKLEEETPTFPKELLQEFANKTDRIMGTANTFFSMYPEHQVFQQIGNFAALCKATGYKASTLNNLSLIVIFAAFWADTLDILEEMIANVGDEEKLKEVNKSSAPLLQKRLVWLAQKIVSFTKGTEGGEQAAINVDGLLRKLGIDV